MPRTRREIVFFILGGFFLTNAILGELTGGKLFTIPVFNLAGMSLGGIVLSIGVIPWPVVFITTDLVNEYFGYEGVRKLTMLAVAMISYAFLILLLEMQVPAWENSPVSSSIFSTVFGQSMWIIVGSLAAFLVSQLVDVVIFHTLKARTGHRFLWLRSTGSTVISQMVDTFIVLYIGFVIPGKLTFPDFLRAATGNYLFKVLVAILITPLIYLGHNVIDRFLEREYAMPFAAGEPHHAPWICPNPDCSAYLPPRARYCPACGLTVSASSDC